jgi:pimeloyl-ACP methyl ester carboxylesterase
LKGPKVPVPLVSAPYVEGVNNQAASRLRVPSPKRTLVLVLVVASASIGAWILMSLALGLGLPRVDDGLLAVLLGAAALAAGVGLVIAVSVLLLKRFRGWALLILVPGTLALLVGVYGLSIALAAVNPPHPLSSDSQAGAERIVMTTADGVRLSGWYHPSRNGAAVVLRHGANSTAANTVAHAEALSGAGYGVLTTDARGHGDSGGKGMDLGWFGDSDTRAAVDYLTTRVDVDPERIAVVGLSMGGEEAIGAAGTDTRIKAVVAEGATGRTAADKTWLVEEYGVAGGVQRTLDAITYGLIDVMTPAEPPPTLTESIRNAAPTPFLLIAAGAVPDEQSVASRLTAVDPQRVAMWVVPDAHHVQALETAPDQWKDRVIGFLDEALLDGDAP